MNSLFDEKPLSRAGIVPRDYQDQAHDGCFLLWDAGTIGTLIRMATGLGKTLTACLIADTWLRRSDDHRVMVVSYEKQLVWQFADEIKDYLGMEAGIEMQDEEAQRSHRIVVASRQTLLPSLPPTKDQGEELASFGIRPMDVISKRLAEKYIRHLRKGGDRDQIVDDIIDRQRDPLVVNGVQSRLHKFDPALHWLVFFDEAHKHAYRLPSVGHIVDWFSQNPGHRRAGLTATPKRSDNVSLGDVMFPGIAIDYPLYSTERACAVSDGWAVPYVQRYIEVEGVDFKNIKRVSQEEGADFDEAALERALGEEAILAKLCGPLLDMAGDRRFLIFSPGKVMSKDVARFINVRSPTKCECGAVKWYPRELLAEGVDCQCGATVGMDHITRQGEQARQLDGDDPPYERRHVYQAHQEGKFQFLSVCGLCREGYNDPDIAGIAVFRPVSKKASALAEQMKGRSCRVVRALAKILHTFTDAEARKKAIAESDKPNALIVDLVGITGLGDCASTVEIYAEGLPDDVKDRAEQILASKGQDEDVDVDEAIAQAQQDVKELKEKIRKEREEAERKAKEEFERRSKAQAEARYTTQEVGYGSQADPLMASEGQYKFMAFLGMRIKVAMHKRKAGRIIGQLKKRTPPEEVARLNNLDSDAWEATKPTSKQLWFGGQKGAPMSRAKTGYDASLLIDAKTNPEGFAKKQTEEIRGARTADELVAAGKNVLLVRGVLDQERYDKLVVEGTARRQQLSSLADDSIPD